MIKDELKNIEKYENLPENLKIAFSFLQNNDLKSFENGRYEIKGDEIFAIVQDYHTKSVEGAKFEVHKKYTDIQYMIKGSELMGFADINKFSYAKNFENDIEFLTPKEGFKTNFLQVKEGEFVVFTPQDAHLPSIGEDEHYVKKVVVKLKG